MFALKTPTEAFKRPDIELPAVVQRFLCEQKDRHGGTRWGIIKAGLCTRLYFFPPWHVINLKFKISGLNVLRSPIIPETNGPTASHNALYACRHLRRLSLCAVGRTSGSHRKNRYSVPL